MVMATASFDRERIRLIRAILGLTQVQFAEKLGVNVSTVVSWELGKSLPTKGPKLGALLAAEREAQRVD